MTKLNCWEFMKCGREPGGRRAFELGICPAATAVELNGTNSGKNGGRACWPVAGTLCGGKVQGIFAIKLPNCMQCPFFRTVGSEEGPSHEGAKDILKKIRH